ncbi:hypothetical protein HK105_208858 [Polyrhizophydium stewartii]|uniref:Transmembrane protein 231 n=1 Tax=Polyrhizophydium stewartii TaxID=2732419 RepID=A0ABR4MWL8_9FUNG
MLVTVFAAPAAVRRYAAPVCSLAVLLWLGVCVALLLLPLALSYAAGSFWLKENAFWEQPLVAYSQEMLLLVECVSASTGLLSTVMYSSDPTFNVLIDSFVRQPAARSWMIDANADGKTDVMHFNFSVPVLDDEIVQHVRLALGVQYQISDRIRLLTRSLILIDAASPLGGSSLSLDGDLNLVQRWPMLDRVTYVHDRPAINFTQAVGDDIMSLTWPRIVSDYLDNDGAPFVLTAKVRVPVDRIVYRPAVLEVLKHGWIQYSSCLALVAAVLLPIYGYSLRHQIVSTHVTLQSTGPVAAQASRERAGFKKPLF